MKYALFIIPISLLTVSLIVGSLSPIHTEKRTAEDFIDSSKLPEDIQLHIVKSCYDCHSNETQTPFYSYFYPISDYVKGHVEHGRKELNLSHWTSYSFSDQIKLLQGMKNSLYKNEMPLSSYSMLHPSADLSDDQKNNIAKSLSLEQSRLAKESFALRMSGSSIIIQDSVINSSESHSSIDLEGNTSLLKSSSRFEIVSFPNLYVISPRYARNESIISSSDSLYFLREIAHMEGFFYCSLSNNNYNAHYFDLETFVSHILFSSPNPIDSIQILSNYE